jgi:dipeptidyl aminopeptidase/acylaminoacyl peptidase
VVGKIHTSLALSATVILVLALSLVGVGCGGAAVELRNPSKTRTPVITDAKKMSPEDLLFDQEIDQVKVSPDGAHVSWTRVAYQPDSSIPATDLFVTATGDLATLQLTTGINVGDVKWSPDSSHLAFLSGTPSSVVGTGATGAQVWVIQSSGGEALPLTQAKYGVKAYGWRGPQNIVYSAADPERSPTVDPPVSADDHTVHVSDISNAKCNLYQVPIAGGLPTTLFKADDLITTLSISPDGTHAFMNRTKARQETLGREYYQKVPITNHVVNLADGTGRQILSTVRQVSDYGWSPDSRTLYVVDDYAEGEYLLGYIARLWTCDVASGSAKLVDLDWDAALDINNNNLIGTQQGFVAALASGFNPKMAVYTRGGAGWRRSVLKGAHQGNMFSFDVSADNRTVAYFYSTASKPPQGYVASLKGDTVSGERQFTSINQNLEAKSPAVTETITWKGALGDTVEGLLYYPSGYEKGKRYPLVLSLHGGPFGPEEDQWVLHYHRWTDPRQLFAQKGAFVLVPNFHGSGNYGYEEAEALAGDYYLQCQDDEAGIDRLIELGMVDENKLGTMGWSNGGITSNKLIATDQRFKAASCGAGGADWDALWGASAYGDHSNSYFFGGDPTEVPHTYIDPANAPMYDAGNVRTPVIMFGGTEDEAVPVGMTWNTYRAIQKHGKAPVELYLFPDQPHVLSSTTYQLRKVVQEQNWFDKYLFGKST